MSLRRAALLVCASALFACTDVTQSEQPETLVFASFSSPNIPTPNDLALQAVPTLTAPQAAAQRELLQTFIDTGGFPSDQEVPISIPLRAVAWDPDAGTNGNYVPTAVPDVDLATVTASTVALLQLGGAAPTPVAFTASYAAGVLSLRKAPDATGSRRWAPDARYVVAVRGGPNGVRTTDGQQIHPDTAVQLAIPNRDLTQRENQPLGAIPDSNANGTNADEIAQLEGVRAALWLPLDWSAAGAFWTPAPNTAFQPAFQAVNTVFPYAETASIATFGTAPSAGPVVLIDSGSGVAPLPIDLLRTGPKNPDGINTVANNPAFGPAAAGIATLDGFSTTAMMLAQPSQPIDASTVTGANVHVFRLSGGTATLVRELKRELGAAQVGDPTANPAAAGYVAQPSQIVIPGPSAGCPIAGGCSSAIGLQPAVTAPVPGVGDFFLPPLQGSTLYAVVVTSRVKGVTGASLAKPTVARIILDMVNEPATPGDAGVSLLSGVSAETARALRDMRAALAPVWDALPTGTTRADVVTAYTFRTQTTTSTSLQLAAAPYGVEAGAGAAIFTPSAAAAVTPPVGTPTTNIAGFYEVTFNSVDGIDKTSGAFRPTLAADLANPAVLATLFTPLRALVAVPEAAAVPLCPSPPFPAGARCAKLVIVGHGLNGSKETLYALASALASQGFLAAAIDFPLHGTRNWCSANADCADGAVDGVCTPFTGGAGQGDAVPPGTCTTGVPKPASSRYFIGANFFRTRDAFRQNVLDQSALTLALSRPPTLPAPAGNPFAAVLPAGVIVDPSAVYYEGVSLGSISGTSVVATHPRISRAALSVGGGTVVDVFTNSPAFQTSVDALFATLIPGYTRAKITAGDPAFDPAIAAAYLRTLNVAKWILDPADPLNYAAHVRTAPLPDLLADPTGATPQAAKAAFAQVALGDTVVPNAFNYLLDNLIGADITTYTDDDPAGGPAPHSMLGSIAQVQLDAALYLVDPIANVPPATRAVTVP